MVGRSAPVSAALAVALSRRCRSCSWDWNICESRQNLLHEPRKPCSSHTFAFRFGRGGLVCGSHLRRSSLSLVCPAHSLAFLVETADAGLPRRQAGGLRAHSGQLVHAKTGAPGCHAHPHTASFPCTTAQRSAAATVCPTRETARLVVGLSGQNLTVDFHYRRALEAVSLPSRHRVCHTRRWMSGTRARSSRAPSRRA